MTTTLLEKSSRHQRPSFDGHGTKLALGRKRNWSWMAGGLLLVVAGALAVGMWSSALSDRHAVLVAAREIPPGAIITRGDLRPIQVAMDESGSTIATSLAAQVVGKRAGVLIPKGAFLHPDYVIVGSAIAPGNAVVGVALIPGAIPVSDLGVGDRVGVVAVSDSTTPGAASPEMVATAKVVRVVPSPDSDKVVVSLEVAEDDAAVIANAAGHDLVRLVLLGNGEGP